MGDHSDLSAPGLRACYALSGPCLSLERFSGIERERSSLRHIPKTREKLTVMAEGSGGEAKRIPP